MSDSKRLIKKYPNRRLYDTAISSYITLEDVRELVLGQVNFKVVDARSQEDITHCTLLQIINEQEESGAPLLSNELLQQLIRHYGDDSMQSTISHFLEQSMHFIIDQQTEANKDFNSLLQSNSVSPLNAPAKPQQTFHAIATEVTPLNEKTVEESLS